MTILDLQDLEPEFEAPAAASSATSSNCC
ncbi:class III lanthipeptide [Nonomuraea sp. NPDC003707]